MNRNDLYNSFHEIDDTILERSETVARTSKKTIWLKLAAAAACLCLIGAIVLPRFLPEDFGKAPSSPSVDSEEVSSSLPETPSYAEIPSEKLPDEPDTALYGNTSDTYASLPELLAYLSRHDTHDSDNTESAGGNMSSPSNGKASQSETIVLVENTGVAVNAAGEYSYHIGKSSVLISRLKGDDTENAGSIPISADALFVCNNNLLVLSRYQSEGDILNPEISVRLYIYDITVPQSPVLLDEYTQLGDLTACWMSGADLYLITSDGVCACGWSRLEDSSGYYPSLSRNGEPVEWKDSEISILGEPTKIQYCAATIINGNSRDVVEKKALYGNIRNLFYGTDWMAATVAGETASLLENPVVYTFDSKLNYTGKIPAAQIIDAPEINAQKDYSPQDGTYLNIVSLTRQSGIYYLLGTCRVRNEGNTSSYFMAIAADTETGESGSRLLSAGNYPSGLFTEIIWEENRALSCIGVMSDRTTADTRRETRFLFTEFDGLDISFHENDLTADYLNCRVGVGYGNPFGAFQTLIPMGDGIYVRYSNPAEGPGGFDVFDFSDSSDPFCVYSSQASLSGDDAFDYVWYLYDQNTFGTLKVLLGAEDYFRNVKLSWCVYTVDARAETPIAFQKECLLDEEIKTYSGADALGYVVFGAGDHIYYVTREQTSARPLK